MKNSLAYFVWLASSVMLLSGCEGLPIKNDTSEPSALQQLKSNNPNGINIITEENKAIYDKKLRTYIAKEYGRVEIALIQGELNKIYQSFFEKMNVTVGYMPKVIVRISGLNQIYLAENGDVVIDYSLLKQLDKPDLIATLLANSAALVAVGYGDFKQAQKVLDVATMLLGTKSQINTSTVGSIQDKLTSMAIDELSSGVEQSLLKKSDAIALELLAIGIYTSFWYN